MGRWTPWVLVVLLGPLTLLPALRHDVASWSGGGEASTTIRQYNAVFDIDEFGDMQVSETLVVHFPDDHDERGILRVFDEYDRNQDRASRRPRDVSVTRDGRPEPYEELSTQQGRFRMIRIGDGEVQLSPGAHTYVITYAIDDVLVSRGAGARFDWDLIPAGWAQEIARAELTVRLPEPPAEGEPLRCEVGGDSAAGCDVKAAGRSLTVQTESLPRNTPLTVGVTLPSAPPRADSLLPWSVSWRPVLGSVPWVPLGVLAAVAFAGWFGRRIAAATFEKDPRFPLEYAPPAGVGPAQARYLLTESTPNEVFVATLMYAAERGAIDLSREGDGWRVRARTESASLELDPATRAATSALVPRVGSEFVVSKRDATSGARVQAARGEVTRATSRWARDEGLMTKAGWGSLAGVGAVAALVLYVVLLAALWSHFTLLALVPGAFFAMALPVLYPGATTKRTTAGRHLWSRVGGFRRVLSTASSRERSDFAARELYPVYLPWAVAFGCADEWAAKCHVERAVEPPSPVHIGGLTGFSAGDGKDTFISDFSSALDGAVSAYRETLSGSSDGGGGFAGGRGGGGGGDRGGAGGVSR